MIGVLLLAVGIIGGCSLLAFGFVFGLEKLADSKFIRRM